MSGHGVLSGFHLGQPVTEAPPREGDANGNGDVRGAGGVFTNPESNETKRMERELVERAMGGDTALAGVPVHSFDPDATPLQKASATATGGGRFLGAGISGLGKIGSTGFGAVHKVGTTGLGTVQKVGEVGVGGVTKLGTTGIAGVQKIGELGVGGVQMIGGVGAGAIGAVGHGARGVLGSGRDHAENDGAHSLAVDLSTGLDDDEVGGIIGLEEEQLAGKVPGGEGREMIKGQQTVEAVVGWLQSIGGVSSGRTIAQLVEQNKREETNNILTVLVPPSFYGTVYHNSAIIIFAVLATRVLTLLHMGWAWIVILLTICSSVYTISMERTRARARDDISRELTKVRLVDETETADWINNLLDRAWLIAEPLLGATVVAMVDDILANSPLPPGLESVRMTTFTLGNKAPKIDSVRTYPETPDDEIIMEWALSFTPNDLEDLTPRQARSKVNPKIALDVRIGKGVVSAGLPILLQDISFTGKMRIKLKLMSNFPHVQTVQMSFMEKPDFDYVLKPLTPFDVNSIPGLSSFIKDQVHANLGPMMYDPNVFTVNLEQLLSGRPLDSAIGVLKVTIDSAQGLKATKIGGGDPDPYVSLSLGTKAHVGKTSIKRNTGHPRWQEQRWILLNTVADTLSLQIYDYNEHRVDSLLGTVKCDLSTLLQDMERPNQIGKIQHEGRDRGDILYSLVFYPVVQPKQLEDGTIEDVDANVKEGIVRLTIHQAKDLDLSQIRGTASTYAEARLRGKLLFKTPVIKHSNTPTYESSTEFLVADKNACLVDIAIVDDKAVGRDPVIGRCRVKLADLLARQELQQDWFDLSRTGKVRLTVDWKPLEIPGGLNSSAAWTPPIGIMRIFVRNAKGVKNVELGGKSDPYCRVISNNTVTGRTETIWNNLNPEWNSYVYAPVRSLQDRLTLEVMDYESNNKDRRLGSVTVSVSEYIQQSGSTYTSTGPREKEEPIRLKGDKGVKGVLHFHAVFVPCVPTKGIQFPEVPNAAQVLAQGNPADRIQGTYTNLRKTSSRSLRSSSRQAMASFESIVPDVPPMIPEKEVLDFANNSEEAQSNVPESREPNAALQLSKDEILKQEHGILVIRIFAGKVSHKGRLEVLLDENYWPAYSTDRTHGHNLAEWNQTAECFIRELSFSQITFRMNRADETERDEVDSEVQFSTKDLVDMSLDQPRIIELRSTKGEEASRILIACKYLPVEMTLDARETVNNMGSLRVELVEGENIKGVDRNGKSDPYVVFNLNGERVFKSQVQKKTLTPKWNEVFNITVNSRVDDLLELELYDWNQIENAKLLGKGTINLADLQAFQSTEYNVPLTNIKDGSHASIKLRIVFAPAMVRRARRHTSTMQAGGRVVSTVGAIPLGVGKGVGKGVFYGGKGIIHGVGFAGRKVGLVKKRDKHGNEVMVPASDDEHHAAGNISESEPETSFSGARGFGSPESTGATVPLPLADVGRVATVNESHAESVNITCVKATLNSTGTHDIKPYVQISLGRKAYKTGHAKQAAELEWNETFKFGLEEKEHNLVVKVFDHKTIGKDREIGQAQLDITHFLQAGPSTGSVELENGQGQVLLQFEPVMGAHMDRHRTPSIASKSSRPVVGSSPSSRFSFKHRN